MKMQFELFNIPVRIKPHFFIIVIALGFSRITQPLYLLSWGLTVFFSILLHELGHAFAARFFGGTPSIELAGLGGVTYTEGRSRKMLPAIIISLAGPLVGISIGLAVTWLQGAITINSKLLWVFLGDVIFINLYWGLANLLPILPLDGGNVAKAILVKILKTRGALAAHILSIILAAPLLVYIFIQKEIYIAFLLLYFAGYNVQCLLYYLKKEKPFAGEIERVRSLLIGKRFEEAIKEGEVLLQSVEPASPRSDIIHLISWSYFYMNDFDQALEMLERLPGGKTPDDYLRGLIYFKKKEFERAADFLEKRIHSSNDVNIQSIYFNCLLESGQDVKAYELILNPLFSGIHPELQKRLASRFYEAMDFEKAFQVYSRVFDRHHMATTAYNAACSLARMNNPQKAFSWLKKAVKKGYNNWEHIKSDSDLDSMKELEEFQRWIKGRGTG